MQKQTISKLKKKLDAVFSEYIRRRDADPDGRIVCITCGAMMPWKEAHAGHFISRKRLATRWMEHNVHAQCPKCNLFGAGEQYIHGREIDRRYGGGSAEILYVMSRTTNQMKQSDYLALIEVFKNKLSEM